MAGPRWIDLALIVAIMPLGVWAWRTGQERAGLEATYARYARKVGELEVGDPSKIHLRSLKTGEPLQFAWRVFLPSTQFLDIVSGTRGSNWTGWASSGERIFRVEFRDTEEKGFQIRQSDGNSSATSVFGERALGDLIRGRWDQIIIERAAASELAVADPSKPLVLLRLILPPEIETEARAKLSDRLKQDLPTIYELTIKPRS